VAPAQSATRAGSECHTHSLRRPLDAEPPAQELEIADLPFWELVAGVSAELHLDAEAAEGDTQDRAFAREILGAEGPSLRAARKMPALRAFSRAVRSASNRGYAARVAVLPRGSCSEQPPLRDANGHRHSAVLFRSWDRMRVQEVRSGKSLPGTASVRSGTASTRSAMGYRLSPG
jgi:hypothetical protein